METAPVMDEPEAVEAPEVLDITAILEAENLLDLLTDNEILRIGTKCLEGFEADIQSRQVGEEGDRWEDRYQRYLDIAMQVRKPKTFPWPKASNFKIPLLTTAALQFQARSYPVIVDGSNLVKGRVLGNDSGKPQLGPDGQPMMQPEVEGEQPQPVWEVPPGAKRARADRVGEHMTWQLLYDMLGWEDATDRLLLQLPIVGSMFRKTYYDAVQKRNCSITVTALDFVINYWAESIEAAPRFTHVMRFYPHECEERFRSGLWRRIGLPVTQDPSDDSETAPVEFLEQFCRIDLDDDGYPEPYIVTLCRESGQVVRLERCFDEDTTVIKTTTGSGGAQEHEVVRIDPKQYFVQYLFFPSPDGSFYGMGFGALLDDITAGIDTGVNQLYDAGTLVNGQNGFIGSGVNMKSGPLRLRPGEWPRVEVTGGTLRENLVPLNLPGPSVVLFELLQFLVGFAKEITSVQDILTGAGQGVNTPATTVLAQIEQATKVMTSIFKRVHRSFGGELRQLFTLNRDHLDEEAYYALTDTPGHIGRKDYEDKDVDVVPVSDPTMVNDAQRAMKAQALLEFRGDPLVNQEEIRRRFFEGTGQTDVKKLLDVPAPPPDPQMLIDSMKQEDEHAKAAADVRAKNAAACASLMQAAQAAQMMNLLDDAATLAGAAVRLGTDAADMEDNGEPASGSGADGGVESPAADPRISQLSQGPAIPPGADVGAGAGNAPAPAGGGRFAGPVAEPEFAEPGAVL